MAPIEKKRADQRTMTQTIAAMRREELLVARTNTLERAGATVDCPITTGSYNPEQRARGQNARCFFDGNRHFTWWTDKFPVHQLSTCS